MADIISFEDKQHLTKEKKDALRKKLKFIAAHKVLHCTRCSNKCEKCGSHINADNSNEDDGEQTRQVPYKFCNNCSEEYIDYIDQLQGKGDPECYWHNKAWLDTWQNWIHYQGAVDSYMKSKEFLELLQELHEEGHE